MRGEPICFLFSVCLPALSHFLPLSFSFFSLQSLSWPPLPPTPCLSFPNHSFRLFLFCFFFYHSDSWSRKKNKKCAQNLLPVVPPNLPLLSRNGNRETFPSITSCQINQSDLWQTPNRTANFSKLSRSSVWFILPEMEGMFSSHVATPSMFTVSESVGEARSLHSVASVWKEKQFSAAPVARLWALQTLREMDSGEAGRAENVAPSATSAQLHPPALPSPPVYLHIALF